jgi:hypothetical protein
VLNKENKIINLEEKRSLASILARPDVNEERLIDLEQNKKSLLITEKTLYFWVEDGARTHDPRYHKPML